MPRRSISVLHTADIHLGSDSYGSDERRAEHELRYRGAFSRIVDRALADRVDLVLIAGDLFDHNRVPDETIDFVRGELARLVQPVVILPGNHDAHYPKSIHDRHDLAAGAPHVRVIRVLDGETIELPELDTVVWGRAMEEHEPAFSPLAHLPGRADGRWCLAMGHGFYYDARQKPDRSSPIFAEEIRDSGWDYVALGHQHVQTNVSHGAVTAYYPGAPATEWSDPAPDASVLRIDLSEAHGVRVVPRPIF